MLRIPLHGAEPRMRLMRPMCGAALLAVSVTLGCGAGPLEPRDIVGTWDVVEWRTQAGRFVVPGTVKLAFGGETTVLYYTYTFASPNTCTIDVGTSESEGRYTDCGYVIDLDQSLLRVEVNHESSQRGTISGGRMILVRYLFPVGTDTLVLQRR